MDSKLQIQSLPNTCPMNHLTYLLMFPCAIVGYLPYPGHHDEQNALRPGHNCDCLHPTELLLQKETLRSTMHMRMCVLD